MQGARQKFRSMGALQSRGPNALQLLPATIDGVRRASSLSDIDEDELQPEDFDGDEGQRQLRRHLDSLKAVHQKERSQLRKLEASLLATELQEQRVAKKMESQRLQLEESKARAAAMEQRLTKLQALESSKDKAMRRSWEPPPTRPTSNNSCTFPVADWSPVDMNALTNDADNLDIEARVAEGTAYIPDAVDDLAMSNALGLAPSASAPILFGTQTSMSMSMVPGDPEDEARGTEGTWRHTVSEIPSWLESPFGNTAQFASSTSQDGGGMEEPASEEHQAATEVQPELQRTVTGHARPKGSMVLPAPRYPVYMPLDPSAALLREVVRAALLQAAGGPRQAFKALDASGSGNVSMTEFEGGLNQLGIPWKELTQCKSVQHVFRLFDTNRAGLLNYYKLFGQDELVVRKKPDTPGFWQEWCHQNQGISDIAVGSASLRSPKWQPDGPEEELKLLFQARNANEEAMVKRAWMRSTIRRMKHRGKSDARCREIVADHLPRGTGPKDLEDVQTFSDVEVRACKRTYQDQVQEPVRNIQKIIYDMREQRRILQISRQKLYATAIEPHKKREAQEEAKQTLGAAGLGGLVSAHLKKDQDLAPDAATLERERLKEQRHAGEKQLAGKLKIGEDQIAEIHKEFCRISGEFPTMDEERISMKQLREVLKALHCEQAFTDGDLEKYWGEMGHRLSGESSMPASPMARSPRAGAGGALSPHSPSAHAAAHSAISSTELQGMGKQKRKTLAPGPGGGSPPQTCSFETFVSWFIGTDFFLINMSTATRL